MVGRRRKVAVKTSTLFGSDNVAEKRPGGALDVAASGAGLLLAAAWRRRSVTRGEERVG